MHDQLLEDIADTWEEDAEPAHRLERLIEEMLDPDRRQPGLLPAGTGDPGERQPGGEAVGTELALIGLSIAGLIRDLYIDGVERPASSADRPRPGHHPDRPADLRGDDRAGQ